MVYLIDTENVGNTAWSEFLKRKTDVEQVVFFYTKNSGPLTFMLLQEVINQFGGQTRIIPCYIGKNALDFQLVSTLGYLIAKAPELSYCILSKDTGYDSAIQFWKDHGAQVSREIPNYTDSTKRNTKKPPEICSEIEQLLAKNQYENCSGKVLFILAESVKFPKNQRKNFIYQQMCTAFGAVKGLTLYRLILTHLDRYYFSFQKAETAA